MTIGGQPVGCPLRSAPGEDPEVARRPARREWIEKAGALEALSVDQIDRRCRMSRRPRCHRLGTTSTRGPAGPSSRAASARRLPLRGPSARRPPASIRACRERVAAHDDQRRPGWPAGAAGAPCAAYRASRAQAWRHRELKKASITVRPRSEARETGRPLWSGSRKSGAGLSPGFQVAWPCRPGGLSCAARATSGVQRVDRDSRTDPERRPPRR